MTGCDASPTLETPELVLWNSEYIHVDLECSPIYECQFIVTIGPFNQETTFDVKLHADYGVDFDFDETVSSVVPSDDHRTSTVDGVHLQQHGTRVVRFPFTINSKVMLAGEYMVMVELVDVDGEDESLPAHKLKIKAFVYIDEYGNIRLMHTQSAFDEEYKNHYTAGNGVHYAIRLDSGDRPIHGKIFIKVIADHDDYDPVLTLHSEGGVEFEPFTPIAICADKGGSRIMVFPFQLIEGKNQRDGRYVFTISIKEDDFAVTHEILPIAIRLVSEAQTHRNQWLELVYGIPTSSVSTPAAIPDVNSGGRYSRTVSTGNAENLENETGQCDSPASIAATVSINETQLPVVDDINIGGGAPDVHSTEEFTGGQPICDKWKFFMSNEQALGLREAYQQYVFDRGIDMSLDVFVAGFRLCNDINKEVGNVTLYGGESYWLPTDSSP